MKAPLTEANPNRVMCCKRTLKGKPCGNVACYAVTTREPVCGQHRIRGMTADARASRFVVQPFPPWTQGTSVR